MTIASSSFAPPSPREWVPSLRGNMIAGCLAILVGFGGFVTWGYTVRLDSAAVAHGSVIVDTRRKTLSHLEGGILLETLVQEGQAVTAGQTLVRLDNTRAKAELQRLQSQRVGLLAKLARLTAEQNNATEINFPSDLTGDANTFLDEIVRNEVLLFERRRETFERAQDVQVKQIAVFEADAAGAAAQLEANRDQQALLEDQIVSVSALVDKGLATRTALVDLQGKLSELVGAAGELSGAQARAEEARAAAELELAKAATTWQSEIADAMQTAQIELSGLDESITSAADVMNRSDIVAPDDGIVANLQVFTSGGVVGPGQPILDIIPENDRRIVEARMDPRDIDSVSVGAEVQVRLPSYSTRQTSPLVGELSYIAADQSIDERTSTAYYIVRATVSAEALEAAPEVTLYPGMPAELLILDKPRMAMDYILSPITDSLSRAFHEQ